MPGEKRRAVVDSEDEDQLDNTQSQKRARTQDSSDNEAPVQSKREKKSKVRRKDDSDSDEDQPGNAEDGDEDAKFEDQHAEQIRAKILSGHKAHGGIAEFGIIERVEMVDFMCHRFLKFDFGPQINFIIGHNGSGKSAVLSAITVALGGKASSTGRGNGLKSFIREGQSVSEVTIFIKNQGDEAYKPKEYGKCIVISRRFTKEGNSSWKIKNKDGKVISTKKDELAAICDHMNIQVDNPMNVLTQDAARQFLSASHPADKYKFFLRGTQLSQLHEEYDTCLENIQQTSKVLAQKKLAVPDLKAALKDASARFEEASKAREQKKKEDDLKKELAWAHVATKEDELARKFADATKIKNKKLPEIQKSLETAQQQFKLATSQVEQFEAEFQDLGDISDLNDRKTAINTEMKANRTKITEFKTTSNEMSSSIKATKIQIEEYDRRIAEEARRLAVNTQAKRDETNRKLEDAKDRVDEASKRLTSANDELRDLQAKWSTARDEGHAAEAERRAARDQVTNCDEMLKKCKEQENNSLAPYGRNIKKVQEQIAKMRWHGDMPLGPLGVHVKVKEPQKWANLMRSQIGQYMTSFACTDGRDRAQLKKILTDSANHHVMIIISSKDIFDYSAGEPEDREAVTVLRALEINDEWVKRILINQANIERTFIAENRRLADETLLRQPRGGVAWSADNMRVQRFPEGGGSSTGLQRINAGDARNMLFTGRNSASEKQHWQEEHRKAEREVQRLTEKINGLRAAFNECEKARGAAEAKAKTCHRELANAKAARDTLQEEANEEMPVGLQGLEEAKREAEQEQESIKEQFADLVRRKAEVDDAQKPLQDELNDIKKKILDFDQKRGVATNKVEEAVETRVTAQNAMDHWKKKINEENEKLTKAEAAASDVEAEFENWTKKAEEFCARIENPRKADVIQRNLDAVKKALAERERRQGATVEEMTIEVNRAKMNLEKVETDLRNMTTLNKALRSSLYIRLAKWQEFRRHIALRCKMVFQYHLSNRGYYGKVLFDHKEGKLELRVQTDDQAQTQGPRDKDAKALSGGEKSFSTICLLLALWDSIGCPLRCLDEFDVFMDAVNRRISMKMMIDTANASDKKQYILITPLSVNMEIGQTIRVHRMIDPERNQGTLSFGNAS